MRNVKSLIHFAILSVSLFLVCNNLLALEVIDHSQRWKVVQTSHRPLPRVDNIVFHPSGTLYVTLEIAYVGKVVEIKKNGKITFIMDYLQRPDGLLLVEDKLYITEEVGMGRIIEHNLKTSAQRVLFKAIKPEGIDQLPNGNLVVSEDRVNGRLLEINLQGKVKVLLRGLNRPEGVCVAKDGAVYIAETMTGNILKYFENRKSIVLSGLIKPDQLECHQDGSLWITEDTSAGRLLRFYQNKLYLIAKDLASPQGIAFDDKGNVYVAEQMRARIIKVIPK